MKNKCINILLEESNRKKNMISFGTVLLIALLLVNGVRGEEFILKIPSEQQWYFYDPAVIAEDTNGNVYIKDIHEGIQKFSSSGEFLTKWGSYGSEDGQFRNPQGIAIDIDGNIYIADTDNNRIQKFSSSGEFLTKWGSYGSEDGQFRNPKGIAIDGSGNVYVVDYFNHRIQKFSSSGEFLTKWGSLGSGDDQLNYPTRIAVDGNGNIYVTNYGNDRIQKFSSSGEFLTKWGSYGSGDGQFRNPQGIAADNDGNIYIVDWENHRVQKFSSSGEFLTKWGSLGGGDGQFYYPRGITVDGSGIVYIADSGNHRIQKFSSSGEFLTKWGSHGEDGQFNSPKGIAVDNDGNIYAADSGNHRIQKFSSSGEFLTKWGSYGSEDGQFRNPQGIAIDIDGNIYVADSGNHRIQKFSSSGEFLTKWGSYGGGDSPRGIAVDSNRNVYVVDYYNNSIQKFSSSGEFLTKWTVKPMYYVEGIAVDSGGNVYVTDFFYIQKFSSSGILLAKWGEWGTNDGEFHYPMGIAVVGNNVYITDYGNHRVQKLNLSGAFLAKWGSYGNGDGQFYYPMGIAADGGGNVYVADSFNHRIQKFAVPSINIQDKSLLQVEGKPEVYWYQNNKLYWITDSNVINSMSIIPGWDKVNTLQSSEFNPANYQQGPRFITTGTESNGLLVRQIDDYKVYLIENGKKRHITYPDVMILKGYSFDNVINVSSTIINMFPLGDPIGIEIDLYFNKKTSSGDVPNVEKFTNGETVKSITDITVVEDYTVETYVKMNKPDGTSKYAYHDNADMSDPLKFSDTERTLYPGTWKAITKIWNWNEYTFTGDEMEGVYDWEFWYKDTVSGKILGKDVQGYEFRKTVPTASITVVTPNGGENWQAGTTQSIKWSYTGNPGNNVKIELLKSGIVDQTIISSTPISSNSYNWIVPSIAGTDYQIRITSMTNGAYTDISDEYFTISPIVIPIPTSTPTPTVNPPSSITVISPNGGEIWFDSDTKTIKWTYTGNPGDNIRIELLKGGILSQTLADSVPIINGQYDWAISWIPETGDDYQIRITSTTNDAYNDISNNYFKIGVTNVHSVLAVDVNGEELNLYTGTPIYIKGINLVPNELFSWNIYNMEDPSCMDIPGIGCGVIVSSGVSNPIRTDSGGNIKDPYYHTGWSIPDLDNNGHKYKLAVTIGYDKPVNYTRIDLFESALTNPLVIEKVYSTPQRAEKGQLYYLSVIVKNTDSIDRDATITVSESDYPIKIKPGTAEQVGGPDSSLISSFNIQSSYPKVQSLKKTIRANSVGTFKFNFQHEWDWLKILSTVIENDLGLDGMKTGSLLVGAKILCKNTLCGIAYQINDMLYAQKYSLERIRYDYTITADTAIYPENNGANVVTIVPTYKYQYLEIAWKTSGMFAVIGPVVGMIFPNGEEWRIVKNWNIRPLMVGSGYAATKSDMEIAIDPDFNYTRIAVPEPVHIDEIDTYEQPAKDFVSRSANILWNIRALKTSLGRYEGAKIDNNPEWMVKQLDASLTYNEKVLTDFYYQSKYIIGLTSTLQKLNFSPSVQEIEEAKQKVVAREYSPDEMNALAKLDISDQDIMDMKYDITNTSISDIQNYNTTIKLALLSIISYNTNVTKSILDQKNNIEIGQLGYNASNGTSKEITELETLKSQIQTGLDKGYVTDDLDQKISTMINKSMMIIKNTNNISYMYYFEFATNSLGKSVEIPLDVDPPQITINVPVNESKYTLNQNVLANWSVIDLGSGIVSKTGTKQNGEAIDTSTIGTKTFTVNATDNAGNSATKTVSYKVVYNFAGFFQPIDNLPTLNSVKAGSAIPVKFNLSGNQGLNIFASGYPGSQKINCDSNAPISDIEVTITAGSSNLSYNVIIDQYNYVWKTDKTWTGSCRNLTVKLKDGTYRNASFKFK